MTDQYKKIDEVLHGNAEITPHDIKPKIKKLDIKALLWDVYGTMLYLNVGDLDDVNASKKRMVTSCRKLIDYFDLKIDAEKLATIYKQTIKAEQEKKEQEGIEFPEVKIEKIWEKLLTIINNENIDPKIIAYAFDSFINSPKVLYPNLLETLDYIRSKGIRLGIISNAQFYTKINLINLGLDIEKYFEKELVFFSFETGYSKPNIGSFKKVKKTLSDLLPENIGYIGNDMKKDINSANTVGFRSILYAGDKKQTKLNYDTKPDCIITDHAQLKEIL